MVFGRRLNRFFLEGMDDGLNTSFDEEGFEVLWKWKMIYFSIECVPNQGIKDIKRKVYLWNLQIVTFQFCVRNCVEQKMEGLSKYCV